MVHGRPRQGCTGSPQLFVMTVNMIIREILEITVGYRDEVFSISHSFLCGRWTADGTANELPTRLTYRVKTVNQYTGSLGQTLLTKIVNVL